MEAAHGVDDFIRSSELTALRKKDKKAKKARGAKGKKAEQAEQEETEEEEEEEEEEEVESESIDGFISRVNLYVLVNCSRASGSRPTHKDALVYQTRKDLINEFLKSAILNKCQNEDCGW